MKKTKSNHVVVLVHGIRTRAEWAEKVAEIIRNELGLDVQPVSYDYLDAFSFLFPSIAQAKAIERIRNAISDLDHSEISIIAHSFGTYAVSKLLEEPSIRLNKIIFCGSIVPSSFRKAKFGDRIAHKEILNDCGTHDIWPILARNCTWGYGATGTFGFRSVGIKDRFNKFSHSDYFDSKFVLEYWIPFLRDGKIEPSEWEKVRKSPWWISLLDKVPVKWVFTLSLCAALLWPLIISPKYFATPKMSFKRTWITHWVGVPVVVGLAQFENSTSRPVTFTNVEFAITDQGGKTTHMELEGFLLPNGYFAPLMEVSAQPQQENLEFQYVFVGDKKNAKTLSERVIQEISSQSTALLNPPRPSFHIFSDALTQLLQASARENFIWKDGVWNASLSYRVESHKLDQNFEFQVTASQSEKLKTRIENYHSGIGVLENWRWIDTDLRFAPIEVDFEDLGSD